ncbi:hypothetical protein, partial [Staphylococcus felis]|uniref:hypothetical protein n=1 Tax=Staphylococcus felis TaxID=46127 RepID=UPI001EE8D89A
MTYIKLIILTLFDALKNAITGNMDSDVHPKSWTKKSNFMGCIFMGKHYKFEIKLKIVQEYLNSSLGY